MNAFFFSKADRTANNTSETITSEINCKVNQRDLKWVNLDTVVFLFGHQSGERQLYEEATESEFHSSMTPWVCLGFLVSGFNYISSIIIHYLRMNGCYVEYILLNKAKQVVSPHTQCCCVQFLKHPPDVMNPAVFHSMSVNNYKRNFYKRNKTCWNILKKQMFVDVRYILIH